MGCNTELGWSVQHRALTHWAHTLVQPAPRSSIRTSQPPSTACSHYSPGRPPPDSKLDSLCFLPSLTQHALYLWLWLRATFVKFTHTHVCVGGCSFLWQHVPHGVNVCPFIHPFYCRRPFGSLPGVAVTSNATMSTLVCVLGWTHLHFSWVRAWEWVGGSDRVWTSHRSRHRQAVLKWEFQWHSRQQDIRALVAPRLNHTFRILAILVGVRSLDYGFNLHCPDSEWSWETRSCLWTIGKSSSVRCLFNSSVHVFLNYM